MLEQGLFLMVIGMAITFIFLGILIWAVQIASKIIWKFFPEPEEPVTPPVRPVTADIEIAIAVAAVAARSNK